MGKIQLVDAETLYYKPLIRPQMIIDGILSSGLAIMAGGSRFSGVRVARFFAKDTKRWPVLPMTRKGCAASL